MLTNQELRPWLESSGFKCEANPLRREFNNCGWYAWRRTSLKARDCETNDYKIQIIAFPSSMEFDGRRHESVEVELCGEAGGIWWKLQAYSLSPEELKARLPEIERGLVAAWSALTPVAVISAEPTDAQISAVVVAQAEHKGE